MRRLNAINDPLARRMIDRRWSSALGSHVTYVGTPGARHDVVLSLSGSRTQAYDELGRWLAAYVDSCRADHNTGRQLPGRQRWTRAPLPATRASTSASVAIDVSPGVVIARAPWAAPYSSDSASDRPVSRP